MGAPYSGKNALIYLSGQELVGANAWSINSTNQASEAPQFNDTWMRQVPGLLNWGGNITAWDQGDESILFDMATAGVAIDMIIYPDRGTPANYYQGNAIFGVNSSGSTSSPVDKTGDFVGDGALSVNGFT